MEGALRLYFPYTEPILQFGLGCRGYHMGPSANIVETVMAGFLAGLVREILIKLRPFLTDGASLIYTITDTDNCRLISLLMFYIVACHLQG